MWIKLIRIRCIFILSHPNYFIKIHNITNLSKIDIDVSDKNVQYNQFYKNLG